MKNAILMIISLSLVHTALASELLVPSQYPTIQSAIDAASNGDTVTVEPNTYRENINFKGKAITVQGSNPSDWDAVRNTIIDGSNVGTCVVFDNGEDNNSILEGFTITNGRGTMIRDPYAPYNYVYAGGGILCRDSSPTIRRCNIRANGFGYYTYNVDYGGGIALIGNCQARINNCFIVDNEASQRGGGIIIQSDAPETAQSTITNCTVSNNEVSSRFGHPERYEADCGDTQPIISSTIIWGHTRSLLIPDLSLVTYSCLSDVYILEGNQHTYVDPCDFAVAEGNMSEKPRFIRLFQTDIEEADYHLHPDSPCIDAGDPAFAGSGETDIDGEPRIMGGRIDIGADEVVPEITVRQPVGGEVWTSGSIHEIFWSSYNIGTMAVDIRFSEDGGSNWQAIESGIPDTNNYVWQLPDIVDSNECLISVVPSIPDPNVACIESGLFTIRPYSSGPVVESKWKSLGGDFKRAGLSENSGPELGCIKWKFETDGPVSTSVTVGVDDRVHIACEDGNLYTLDPNGLLIWNYDANSPLLSSPTVGLDGTVYVGSQNGKLYVIDINGNLRWTHTTDGFIYSSPALSADGNVYVCSQDGKLYTLGQDGSELWSFQTNGPGMVPSGSILSSPTIGADGSVYIAGLYDPNLYALNANDGSLKWACGFEFPIDPCDPNNETKVGWPFASPVVAADGTIYQTLLYDSSLYAIEPNNGIIIWSKDLADPSVLWFDPYYGEKYGQAGGWSEPALGPDGTIYVSFDDPYLRAVDPNGSIKWVARLGVMGGFTLTVGSNGLIYAACDDGYLCVVDANGCEVARFRSDAWLNFPVIAANNTIIVSDGKDNPMLISDANNTVWAIGLDGCEGQGFDLHWIEDLDSDGNVNLVDLALLAADWLECTDTRVYPPYCYPFCGCCKSEMYLIGDIDRDQYVYFSDLGAIAYRWLGDDSLHRQPRPTRPPGPPPGWPEPPPCQAGNPSPADGAEGIDGRVTKLSWTTGFGAKSHNIYFGTNFDDVKDSTADTFKGNQTATTFDPGTLARYTTYYWRIDEINSSGVTIGEVWSFTTTTWRQ